MSMFSFQAIHNTAHLCHFWGSLFIDYVNVLFSSNSQLSTVSPWRTCCCLSIMSMFSFQAIHNHRKGLYRFFRVVYRLCQCSLFKQFTTTTPTKKKARGCLSIMSMFSFQAIHNRRRRRTSGPVVVYRLCQCSLFKQFTTDGLVGVSVSQLFIDYVNVLFSSNSQLFCVNLVFEAGCLSIMSMFSFQAIHNEPSRFIFRCKGTFFFGQCQIYFSRS